MRLCAFCDEEISDHAQCQCHGAVQYRKCSAPLRAKLDRYREALDLVHANLERGLMTNDPEVMRAAMRASFYKTAEALGLHVEA